MVVHQARLDRRGPQDLRARQGRQGHLDPRESVVRRAHLVRRQDLPVRPVYQAGSAAGAAAHAAAGIRVVARSGVEEL